MLSGNQSISHYTRSNITLWMVMAFQAGMLNVGGFLGFQRFVSHITGFASYFGRDMAMFHYGHALGMLAVPGFFLLGAMISGWLVDIRLAQGQKPKYYIAFGVIFALILANLIGGVFGWYGGFGESFELGRNYFPLALLCLACGIQNGTITSVSRSVVRTTHLTGITTDLGIGIARVMNRQKLPKPMHDEVRANLMRAGIIVFFGLGSVVGGFAFQAYEYGGFILPAVTSGNLFMITYYYQVVRQRPS
jgi:uncharacterized membrane protein YoaK (UPF0700 family)